jgi:hypothetical protein
MDRLEWQKPPHVLAWWQRQTRIESLSRFPSRSDKMPVDLMTGVMGVAAGRS